MMKLLTPEEEVEVYKRENERLEGRVRELQAERSAMIDNVRFARERAERAEAERDVLRLEAAAHQQEANALANYVGAMRALLRCCPFDYDGPMTDGQYKWVQDVRAALKEKP